MNEDVSTCAGRLEWRRVGRMLSLVWDIVRKGSSIGSRSSEYEISEF